MARARFKILLVLSFVFVFGLLSFYVYSMILLKGAREELMKSKDFIIIYNSDVMLCDSMSNCLAADGKPVNTTLINCYSPGQAKAIGHFKDGKAYGKYVIYDIDGDAVRESSYLDGVEDGTVKVYKEKKLNTLYTVVKGVKSGPVAIYNADGELLVSFNYINGVIQGEMQIRGESGLYVLQFKDGVATVGEKTVGSAKEPVTVEELTFYTNEYKNLNLD